MLHTNLTHCFFDSVHQKFRTMNFRHCPRYVLFRMDRVEHRQYSPVIDAVYDSALKAAEIIYAPNELDHGNILVTMSGAGVPVLARVVMSSSVSTWIREGKPPIEDVLIAGFYSKLWGHLQNSDSVAIHLHYVQPRPLYHHHRTLPVMYRPYFVTEKDDKAQVNMRETRCVVKWVQDGLEKLEHYHQHGEVPASRPLNYENEKTNCEYCPYSQLCDVADKMKLYSTEKLKDVNFVPKASKNA